MADLTNTNINDTYVGLIKTDDNAAVTSSGLRRLSDGLGNDISLSINSSNNGICAHGNIQFDCFCNFSSFPTGPAPSCDQVLIANGSNITLDSANNTLTDRFSFSGGLSTISFPQNIQIDNKGVIRGICDKRTPQTRTYFFRNPLPLGTLTQQFQCNTGNSKLKYHNTNFPSNNSINDFLMNACGLNLKDEEGHYAGDIAYVVAQKFINQSSIRGYGANWVLVYKATAQECTGCGTNNISYIATGTPYIASTVDFTGNYLNPNVITFI